MYRLSWLKTWTLAIVALGAALSTVRAADVPPAYAKVGPAFLAKHCVRCHGAEKPKSDVALHRFPDEASVLKARKRWMQVLEVVEGGTMPPEDQPQPTADERLAFAAAAHAVFERADNVGKTDPGEITIRRLNRAEYNNTVRDLLMVDFQPAEDFPADDVGYGFDNIGDVLSVSPVLMERYLAAAETIAQRVIVVDPPKPPSRTLQARYLEPSGKDAPTGKFRPLDPESSEPMKSGPVSSSNYFRFGAHGEYFFRSSLYAETTSDRPVRVALYISGKDLTVRSSDKELKQLVGLPAPPQQPTKILQTFEITARDAKKPQRIETRISRIAGIQRCGLAVIRPAEDDAACKVFVEYLAVEGPMDTRPEAQAAILACSPGKPQAAQTREVLSRLASRAYRRPATKDEVENLAAFVDRAVAEGQKWEAGIQFAIQAMLCSPKFLFRVELDNRPNVAGAHPIDEYQLASRLSYFIWSSMPDDELFALAAQRKLSANLEPQVRRMLRDPKAAALVDNFAMQWLQLGKLQLISPDARLFPSFNEPLRQAMLQETRLFLQEIVREDHSLLDLIQADFTYLNEPLARHYGIIDTLGNRYGQKVEKKGQQFSRQEFVRVSLRDDQRGGLLTQASVLSVTSNPTRTSPVKRGRWILEQILGTPPPPPPPDVPELEKQAAEAPATLRQQMEQHRRNPACANCHAKMDPLGFAFENYDAIGKYRDKDGNAKIDTSGTLPDGRAFNGPQQLEGILLDKKELFVRSLAEKMLTYALGRGLEYYDERAIDRIVRETLKDQAKFSRLVIAVAASEPFRMRRGKEQQP